MKSLKHIFAVIIILILTLMASPGLCGHGAKGGPAKAIMPDGDTINISGIVLDSHKEPIDQATIKVMVNGKEVDQLTTAHNGKYIPFSIEKG